MIRSRTIAAAAVAAVAAGTPVAVAFAAAAPAHRAVQASAPAPTLAPGSGGVHTRFRLTITVPETTGQTGTDTRRDVVSVAGTRSRRCVWQGSFVLPYAHQGSTEHALLTPARLGGRAWCPGAFVGDVVQEEMLQCGPPQASIVCPQLVVRPQVIAQFHFRVKRH